MKNITVQNLRNFVVAGHSGSGKTTLCDALLFKIGANEQLGSPASGTSACDYTNEEKSRKISLYAKPLNGVYKPKSGSPVGLMFIDTPGTDDFFGQVQSAMQVADTALIAIDAVGGIQVGTRSVWRQAENLGTPRAIVVTGLDRESADFNKIFSEIEGTWGDLCAPVMTMADGVPASLLDASDNATPEMVAARNALIEKAAETDDALIEKFLEGETLTAEEIAAGLRSAVAAGSFVPVFIAMPLKDAGISELLDGIARLFPSPQDRSFKDVEGEAVAVGPDAPFSAFVWRSLTDPYAGKMIFARVISGTLTEGTEVLNAARGTKEAVGAFFNVCGKKQTPATEAFAGDIIAISKLKNTALNDSLCALGQKIIFPVITFRSPVVFSAVFAKDGEDDKVGAALQRVIEDDPTMKMERNPNTNEMILSSMGDTQLEWVREMVKKRVNLDLEFKIPKVSYRETITGQGEGHFKHKKQSGGRGQYAEVYAKVQPLAEGEEWFEDAVVGGVIPRNFIPACEKGFTEAMQQGVLAGYPVVNLKVTVYDGSYHDVDSSEIAFKIASSRAFREAVNKAKPVLLEPIMKVRVTVPDQYMGDINGDLNHRRGRILGVDVDDGMQVVTADVPQVELFRYSSELRSITGGRGSFEMEFVRYDIVPSNIAQKVIAESEQVKDDDD